MSNIRIVIPDGQDINLFSSGNTNLGKIYMNGTALTIWGAGTHVNITSGNDLIFKGLAHTIGGTNSILTIGNSGDTIDMTGAGVVYQLPSISTHIDVQLTSLANSDLLQYNGTRWVNKTITGSGISPLAGSTSITTLGTITAGTWNASTIAVAKGGLGLTAITSNHMLYASGTNTYSTFLTSSFGRSLLNATSDVVFTGLNADKLDGFHLDTTGSTGGPWGFVPLVNTDGSMGIGRYVDFHHVSNDGVNYKSRLHTDGSTDGELFIDNDKIWNAGNSNLTTIPWSASSLTLNGSLSGVSTINSSGLATLGSLSTTTGIFSSTLNVSGVTTLGSSLNVSGSTVFSSTLGVNGVLTSNSGIIIEGSVNPGATNMGGFRTVGTNLILKGNSTGVSGIFFQSEKDGTNINHSSDYGFIQFHAYGVDGSSGESNRLVIGVANDTTDKLVLQTAYNNNVVVSYQDSTAGTTMPEYVVYHAGNSNLSSVDWTAKSFTSYSSGGTKSVKIYVDDNGNLVVDGNLYATGEVSAYGAGTGSTGGGGGTSYNRLDLWGDYSVDKAGYVLSAYLGNDLNSRLSAIESNGANSIVVNGSGNAITNVSKAGNLITFTKGSTFLTSIDSLIQDNLTYSTAGTTYGLSAYQGYVLNRNDITAISASTTTLTLTRASGNITASIPTWNQNTTGSAGSVSNSLTLTITGGTTEGTNKYTFNGSAAKILNFVAGSNVSIVAGSGSMTISATDTIYTHPTQSAISVGGTRHFITSLGVNTLGHVTGATSAAMTKTDIESLLTGSITSHTHSYLPLSGGVLTGIFDAYSIYNDDSGIYVPFPKGGTRKSSTATETGYIKITLPVSWTGTMMQLCLDVYDYTTSESFTVLLGGYNYQTGPTWTNCSAYIIANNVNRNFNVRFGHDGTKCAIYIGESGSTWSYPQMVVRNFYAGYGGDTASNWATGWSLSITTTLGTITQTISSALSFASKTIQLASGRTLTIGSTGKSFDGTANVSWTLSEIGASPTAGSSSLTTVGTISSGTWAATDVALTHGGTNASLTASAGSIVYSTASAMAFSSVGTSGYLLTSAASGAPTWTNPAIFSGSGHTHPFASLTSKPTTLTGYGITDAAPMDTSSATLPATIGWYRIASSSVDIVRCSGRFEIDWQVSGYHGQTTINSGIMYGQDPTLNLIHYSHYGVSLSKARIVYHSSYAGNYAYLEIYNSVAVALSVKVQLFSTLGWTLTTPTTAGSIPSGYSSQELDFVDGISTEGQLVSRIASGTSPLLVTSTTMVSNLNSNYLGGYLAAYFSPSGGSTSITTLGSVTAGTWNATTIAVTKGGLGLTSITSGHMLYASAANTYSTVISSAFGRSLLNAASGTMFTGLNADLLDGQHASYFIDTSATSQTKSGALTLSAALTVNSTARIGSTTTSGLTIWNGTTGVTLTVDSSGNLKVNGNFYATGEVSAYGLGGSGGTATINADTLNGLASSSFLRNDMGIVSSASQLVPNGLQYMSTGSHDLGGDLPSTVEGTIANFNGFSKSSNALGFKLLVPTSTGIGLFYQSYYNSYRGWTKVYDTKNSNLTTINWSAKDLTLNGSITGLSTIVRTNANAVDEDVYGNLAWKAGTPNSNNWNVGTVFYVYKSGNVMIGSSLPDSGYKLDVNGTFRINYNYSTTFTGNDINFTRTDGSSYINAGQTLSLGAGGTSGVLNLTNANVATFKELLLADGARIYSSAGAGLGISLFNEPSFNPNYGLMFAQTVYKGTHGAVNGDWATYFTMSPDSGRGWIFTSNAAGTGGNVASISNWGNLTCSGSGTFTGGGFNSLRDLKIIHDDWCGSSIEVINKFKIRDFNYKNQVDYNRTLGFIIDEVPVEVADYILMGENRDSVNLYSLHALSFKAHQETKSEIDLLKEKIKELNNRIKILENGLE